MGNPARELLDLMDSWASDGTVVTRRTAGMVDDAASVEFWEVQKRAAGLLMRVEEFLKDDGSYEDDAETLAEVWQELFPPCNDWCVEPVLRYMSRGPGRCCDRSGTAWSTSQRRSPISPRGCQGSARGP